jgi:hypothetical protein
MIRARVQIVSSCRFSTTWMRFSQNLGYRFENILCGIAFNENHKLPDVNVNQNKLYFRHIHLHGVQTLSLCRFNGRVNEVGREHIASRRIHTHVGTSVPSCRFSTVWNEVLTKFRLSDKNISCSKRIHIEPRLPTTLVFYLEPSMNTFVNGTLLWGGVRAK